jgi:HSP20 family protein
MITTTASESPTQSSRRRPLRILREEAEDLFSRFVHGLEDAYYMGRLFPPYDLSEAEDVLEIRLDVPGVAPEDIEIRMQGNTLTVRGDRKEARKENGRVFHHQDRRMGKFDLLIPLPSPVEDAKAQAEYHNGVLIITLPKTADIRAHRIEVTS